MGLMALTIKYGGQSWEFAHGHFQFSKMLRLNVGRLLFALLFLLREHNTRNCLNFAIFGL